MSSCSFLLSWKPAWDSGILNILINQKMNVLFILNLYFF
jgi:hypothetical protein